MTFDNWKNTLDNAGPFVGISTLKAILANAPEPLNRLEEQEVQLLAAWINKGCKL